ncbi:hypothetical protein A2Y83_00295 [Candidatus Falkowbacteria bacterium RBG_13_39_14]|uniref:DNA polymerase III subunit delta' n=1 Tax=Candidatus Falkowbacteria bacterium RBG_13_39_14 TaxID=1797985 RepID=A0A1F5S458_9BACT|nr:MAG: hypothetical protein A2Y83_00295 [Candidatus Falkowbacteria bacterium RBG_13_39_14]
MFNWNIAGHENIKKFLENSVIREKIANAYLFYGPEKVGKKDMARQFAKSLFCVNKDRPCEECLNCKQIEANIYPDFFRVARMEEKGNIVIEQVRELREKFYRTSFLSGYKAGIIEEAEFLTDSAWNSFLKILEEPPSMTVIIIIANKIAPIPATIISRCQRIKFSLVPEDEITEHLCERGIERLSARRIARIAGGKIGLAREFANSRELFDKYNEKILTFLRFFEKDMLLKEKNDVIAAISKEREQASESFDIIASLLRDFLLVKTNPDLVVNLAHKEKMIDIGKRFESRKISQMLENCVKFKSYLDSNVNRKLLLENMALEME